MCPKSISKQSHALLDKGIKALNLPIGIVSHIYGDSYEIVALHCKAGTLAVGSILPLSDTYCRDVVAQSKTIALTEINGTPGLKLHPLYLKLPLEAYISSPIFHNGSVWGTINFTASTIRSPFTQSEIALVEAYARQLSERLAHLDSVEHPA